MKILMTTDTIGGVWTYAVELCAALAERGAEVSLATMGRALSREQREAARQSGLAALRESGFKLEWMENPWEEVARCGDWLLEIGQEFAPDIVHLNQYCFGRLPWQARVLVAAHSCVLSWWEAVKGEPAPENVWGRYRAEVSAGLRGADFVVAPSRAMLHSLRAHYAYRAPARAIPNGRSALRFPPGKKQLFLFAAGRLWDEAKGITTLERIEGALPWPVYIAGDDAPPHGEKKPARSSNCTHLGCIPPVEIAGWMSRAAIYCLPARYEPFGLSVLEAGLSGCALVLGDIPSLRENWTGAAVFVPAGDDQALRSALESLIYDPARRARLAAEARCRALTFTPERMASAYLATYREMLGNPRESRPTPEPAHRAEETPACAS